MIHLLPADMLFKTGYINRVADYFEYNMRRFKSPHLTYPLKSKPNSCPYS